MPVASSASLSHLKFRHLLLVDYLVTHRTLHKTARLLSISQPAATGMLNDLEQLLGLQLFTRNRQGMTPTPATWALLDKVRTLLNEFNDLTTTLERVGQGRGTALRLGVVPQAFVTYMPQTIERFRAAGGGALHTQEGTGRQLLDQLLAGQLDAVIGRLPSEGLPQQELVAGLEMLPLYREEVCVVARHDHPILQERRITFKRLAREQWVLQRRDSSVRQAFAEAFMRAGLLPPDPAVETANYLQNIAVVAGSGLLGIAPRRAAEQQQALGQIAILNFRPGVEPMQVSLLVRSVARHSAMLQLFQGALTDTIRG